MKKSKFASETVTNIKITDQDALDFHANGKPGKISIKPTKPLLTQRDLSLAYSPGVALPCMEIKRDQNTVYRYTAKSNFVAVISNGTAVLGLGNLGAMASKPVMEGKAVLFKRFADIDSIDIEVDTTEPEEFIKCVKYIGNSWGGINLEDIKAPDCFIIEEQIKKHLDIPVFHDDQHGTAIITLAGLINAADITKRDFKNLKIVVNGAGAAAIACVDLIRFYGLPADNIIICDTKGVIYKGRQENMNRWKENFAVDTTHRTLSEAMVGADVFLGLSVKDAISQNDVLSMADNPIIFAMANPDPEITYESVQSVRKDAIFATGRSDYPNQVNNVMGFPYIFRGALDVNAKTINDEMKIAAAESIAMLARETVPEEVALSYAGKKMSYGPEYIIPVPFDSRLITTVPKAVAKAAMDTGVARKPINNFEQYVHELGARLDPTSSNMNFIFEKLPKNPRRIIFSEGEEEQIIRTAILWKNSGYGTPILVGREKQIKDVVNAISSEKELEGIEIWNAANIDSNKLDNYIKYFYAKTYRKGNLYRDCTRLVKNSRNVFASCILACGDGDALVSGVTRSYHKTLDEINSVIDIKKGATLMGCTIMIAEGRTIFISDTTVNEMPKPLELAEIAIQTASQARSFGHRPYVAMLSFSNFGSTSKQKTERVKEAVIELDKKIVDFEYDGEMTADVALNPELLKNYPFCRLSKPANVLIMPALHTANISSQLLQEIGGGTRIGPILSGLEKPVQIIQMGASVSDIFNLAAFAAAESIDTEEDKN